ncbi:MAG: redoxin domain-containing protein [Spirochaetes bacterium]|nr:MAG: redoxin domain-containing protein [Spirochaetota bacterium]
MPKQLIGSAFPGLELDAFHKGALKKVKLADFRGKWLVVIFYPADFSFVCPTELREMADSYDQFRKAGAEVVSVSTDSVYAHRAWAEQNEDIKKIAYPMLSDQAGRLSRALGVYAEDRGIAMRASFVVSPEGTIVACEMHDEAIGRSAAELLRKLEAAVAVRESDGGFCPASWRPGQKMVKPK